MKMIAIFKIGRHLMKLREKDCYHILHQVIIFLKILNVLIFYLVKESIILSDDKPTSIKKSMKVDEDSGAKATQNPSDFNDIGENSDLRTSDIGLESSSEYELEI